MKLYVEIRHGKKSKRERVDYENEKVTGLLAMTVAAVMAMTGCGGNDAADDSAGNKVYHIGIIQQMEHGSLDQATKGFEDKLTELLGEDNVEFDYQNAHGGSRQTAPPFHEICF